MESKLPPFLPLEKFREALAQAVEQSFNAVFSSLGGLEREVDRSLERDIEGSRRRIAETIVEASSRQAAAVGAASSSVDAFPLAWPILVPSILSEFTLCLRIHLSMLLKLSTLYGPDRPRSQRKKEAIGIMATFGSDSFVGGRSYIRFSKDMVRVGGCHVSRHALVSLTRQLLERYLKKRLAGVVPLVGAAASGGLNLVWTRNLGEFAIEVLEAARKDDLAAVGSTVPADSPFVHCLMLALVNAAKCDRAVTPSQKSLLNESMLLFGVGADEREDILRASRDLERIPRLPQAEVERLSPTERQDILDRAEEMLAVDDQVSTNRSQYLQVLRRQLLLDGSRSVDATDEPRGAEGAPAA